MFKQAQRSPRQNTEISTDGAPAIVGRYRGFSIFLMEKVPSLHTIHCVLRRQHLVANRVVNYK